MKFPAAIKHWSWALVVIVALVEIVGQAFIRAGAASVDDYRAAVARIRTEWRQGDLLVSAPSWADPLLRWAAGDMITMSDAGRSDLARYDRVWEVSVRGARAAELQGRDPVATHEVGPITIRRYDQGRSPVLYDFVEQIAGATVDWIQGGEWRSCRQAHTQAIGGGLGQGAIVPADRFICGQGSWQWVGATVQEDERLLPRRCIWTHPSGADPVRVTFADVPLGEQIVFYTGLYNAQERKPYGGPVQMTVKVDGETVGQRWHHAGDGWTRFDVVVPGDRGSGDGIERGQVAVEVAAAEPYHRTFCWSGTVRTARDAAPSRTLSAARGRPARVGGTEP